MLLLLLLLLLLLGRNVEVGVCMSGIDTNTKHKNSGYNVAYTARYGSESKLSPDDRL